MAAGDAQRRDADLHARADDQPLLDRGLDAQIGAACVAHAGDAGVDGVAHVPGRLIELEREGLGHHLGHVDALDHDVDVAVDEAGQYRAAQCIDDRDIAFGHGDLNGGAHFNNQIVLHQHGRVQNRCAAVAVNQCAVAKQCVAHDFLSIDEKAETTDERG